MSYDPSAIGALFSEDAAYRWHPWDEGDDVARGRAEIVKAWLENPDPAGTYVGSYRPLLIQDSSVIAVGASRYYTDGSQAKLDREYYNLWLLEFDGDCHCRSFTEWFMKRPRSNAGGSSSAG